MADAVVTRNVYIDNKTITRRLRVFAFTVELLLTPTLQGKALCS